MDQALHRLTNSLLTLMSNAPESRYSLYARVVLSVLLVLIAARALKRSADAGDKLMGIAVTRLKQRIRSRLSTPKLMTADSIRSLATAIRTELGCAALKDGAIAEAIRSVALDIEADYGGSALVRRLELLNRPLRELDPGGGSLLSIAAIDRMLAYRLSTKVVLCLFVFGQCLHESVLWFSGGRSAWPWVYQLSYCWILLGAFRAARKWTAAARIPDVPSRGHKVAPPKFSILLDTFAVLAATSKDWVHNHIWGILWETFLFHAPRRLLFLHQHKALRVKALLERANELEAQFTLIDAGLAIPDPNITRELTSVYRELWILTGFAKYKELLDKRAVMS